VFPVIERDEPETETFLRLIPDSKPATHQMNFDAHPQFSNSPLWPEPIGKNVFSYWPTGGRPLKRLHRPNLLRLDCMGFKECRSFKICYEHQPYCPQRGPYEASEGTYPDQGQ